MDKTQGVWGLDDFDRLVPGAALSGGSGEVAGVLEEGLGSSDGAKVGFTCPVVVWGDSTSGDAEVSLGHPSFMF